MELLRVDTVQEARVKLLELIAPLFARQEMLLTPDTLGRVLAANLVATEDVPAFVRSTVDGYAVRAADTTGAGESIPSALSLAGSVEMGVPADSFPGLSQGIAPGECAYVPTGGMLPSGADAVVMIEDTELFGPAAPSNAALSPTASRGQVGIYSPVAAGAHVVYPGEDVSKGVVVCSRGTRVGAAEIGVAAALGKTELLVYEKPKLCLISTGDELVAPDAIPCLGQVRDINSWALAASAETAGFDVYGTKVVPDDEKALQAAVEAALLCADVVAISGGSSQGEKDATAQIIDKVASSGVLTHGLALKPGKPSLTGFDESSKTLLIGLPGHPLSALLVFEVLLGWLLRKAQGTPHPLPVPAVLAQSLAGAAGKDTLQLVRVAWQGCSDASGAEELLATPVFAKSGLVSKLAEANGYLWIDRNTEGLEANTPVLVYPLQP